MSQRIYVTFTDEQKDEIENLVGQLGNSPPDVVNTIVATWLYQERKAQTKD